MQKSHEKTKANKTLVCLSLVYGGVPVVMEESEDFKDFSPVLTQTLSFKVDSYIWKTQPQKGSFSCHFYQPSCHGNPIDQISLAFLFLLIEKLESSFLCEGTD